MFVWRYDVKMAVIGKIAGARRYLRLPFLRGFIKNNRTFSVLIKQTNNNQKNFNFLSRLIAKKLYFVNSQTKAMGALSPMDPSSYSRPELAKIDHVNLAFNVDFEKKILHGTAVLNFIVFEEIGEVILDASNIIIESIELDDGTPLNYTIEDPIPNYGSKLLITLANSATAGQKRVRTEDMSTELKVELSSSKNSSPFSNRMSPECGSVRQIDFFEDITNESDETETILSYCICVKQIGSNSEDGLKIKIKYSTSPTATALQWLEPNQTSGKKHPYLFSQCQPIHARSILPCQDTPAVKFTYEAEVTAPEEFTVLMSAIRGENRSTKTTFRQPVPIPSYLLAIAVAVLESRELGPRSHVWSEKAEVEQSAWEFAETEKYLQAAEKLCGPYQWTQYDLLVLPPSFPYGGMENPCLTFVTPTLLAGDRSQADVIVHEIMHSWTGNLVTNRNFEHFWLNEGFTVFLERKVAASLINDTAEAKRSRDFHSLLGLQELSETVIDDLGVENPLTKLVLNLVGVHPDDAFSTVPYEKGSLFLRYLEDLLGGPEVFDDFLRSYLNHFQRESLDTDQFKEYLLNYFKDSDKVQNVDWNTWLHKSGMPPIIPQYDTSMTKAVTALQAQIVQEDHVFTYEDVKSFTPHQMINLLQDLIEKNPLPLDRLRSLGEAYKLTSSKNSEIEYRWLRLCIRSRDDAELSNVFAFVNSQGRMKYVRPIYRDLYAWEEVRTQAIDNFLKNEQYMMHVSAYTLRKDLHLSE